MLLAQARPRYATGPKPAPPHHRTLSAVVRLRQRRGVELRFSRGVRDNRNGGMGRARRGRRIFKNFLFPFTTTYDLQALFVGANRIMFANNTTDGRATEHHVCLIKSALSVRTSTSRQVRGFICCNHTPPLVYPLFIMFVRVYVYMCFIFPPVVSILALLPSVAGVECVPIFFFFISFRTGNRAKKTHRKLRGSSGPVYLYMATGSLALR